MAALRQEELKKLGQNIKRLRKAKGLNQTSLAKAAQTRPTTISSIENGLNQNPGWDLLDRVAKVLSTNIHQLTQPELDADIEKTDRQYAPGLTDLVRRQKELLGLGEPRITQKELEWLSSMPIEDNEYMSAEKFLIILRHYRLVSQS